MESVENLAFLDIDHLLPSPLCLMDFGIERRENKNYDYDNSDRGYYIGYLFQFTLGGCGMFETGGTQTILDKGKCFFLPFPHKSRYHIIENEYWQFCHVHFHGTVADQFYKEIVRKAGGNLFSLSITGETVSYLLKEIESVRMAVNSITTTIKMDILFFRFFLLLMFRSPSLFLYNSHFSTTFTSSRFSLLFPPCFSEVSDRRRILKPAL